MDGTIDCLLILAASCMIKTLGHPTTNIAKKQHVSSQLIEIFLSGNGVR